MIISTHYLTIYLSQFYYESKQITNKYFTTQIERCAVLGKMWVDRRPATKPASALIMITITIC